MRDTLQALLREASDAKRSADFWQAAAGILSGWAGGARLSIRYQGMNEVGSVAAGTDDRSGRSLNAAWQATSAFSLNATVLTVSSWIDGNRDFSIPRLTAPGYTVVNLAASFAIDRHLTVFGRLDNLFDRHFQNPVGFLQPTLGAFAGIRAQL